MTLPCFDIVCALIPVAALLGVARNKISEKLKDKDIAKERLRERIITDVRDVKIKVKLLSLTTLESGEIFLKEGITLIEDALGSQETENYKSCLERAEDRFKKAREQATVAFTNAGLSTLERITAAKLRIVSTILEHFRDVKPTLRLCKLILQDLNSLEQIGANFLEYFMSYYRFYDDLRLEILRSVLHINFVVAEHFASDEVDFEYWPMIELPGDLRRILNPLLVDKKVVKEIFGEEGFQHVHPKNQVYCSPYFDKFAINSTGQVIAMDSSDTRVFRIERNETETGQSVDEFFRLQNSKQKVKALATDRNDNVLVVTTDDVTTDDDPNSRCRFDNFFMFLFNKEGEKIYERKFTVAHRDDGIFKCVIDNQRRIIFHFCSDDHVFIINVFPVLVTSRRIPLEKGEYKTQQMYLQCTTDDESEIVMLTKVESVLFNYPDVVLIYTKNGSHFTLRRKIEVQKDLFVQGVIFNYKTSKLEILASCSTYGKRKPCCILKCREGSASSSNDDTFDHVFLTTMNSKPKLWVISHPNGPVAYVVTSDLHCTAILLL